PGRRVLGSRYQTLRSFLTRWLSVSLMVVARAVLGRDRGRCHAAGAPTPVDDLGLVDLVTRVVGGDQARSVADRAVHVDHAPACSTDQVVVVVADPILVAGRRSGGLNPPEDALVAEDREGVVHRLT